MNSTEQPPVKIRLSRSSHSRSGENEMHITGLSDLETTKIEGMLAGTRWVRVKNGRLQSTARYKKPPSPVDDPVIAPHWPQLDPVPAVQMDLQNISELNVKHAFTASLTVQHLCGYYFSKNNYLREARKLRSFGFTCLRSRRGRDGKYWEIWYLPGLWMSKGALKDVVKDGDKFTRQLSKVVSFMGHNCSFGTLDVSVQRLAMVID